MTDWPMTVAWLAALALLVYVCRTPENPYEVGDVVRVRGRVPFWAHCVGKVVAMDKYKGVWWISVCFPEGACRAFKLHQLSKES